MMYQGNAAGPAKPDWVAIGRAYEGDELTVAEICDKFSVTPGRLYRRRRRESWTPRRGGDGRATAGQGRPETGRTGQLLARVIKAFEAQMKEIETNLNAEGERDPATRERDARTLASLVRTLERLSALQAPRTAAHGEAPSKLEPADIDRMRKSIARRLAQMLPNSGN